MACLLGSISAACDGFGFYFWGLGDILGMGWVRGTVQLAGLPPAFGALFYQDPGIQVTAKVEGDLILLGPSINLTIV